MLIILAVIIVALAFEFINGFHDTANSIATSVSTKVLTPRQAIVVAACTNLLGALWGTAVAKTIASGIVNADMVTPLVIICAISGGIVWNLATWYWGMPSSSSHALIGGLCGATYAAAHNDSSVIIWSQTVGTHFWEYKGVLWKVLVPMLVSPTIGLSVGFLFMAVLYGSLRSVRPRRIRSVFGKLQVLSAAGMGFMHGTNDAQKTMGIITLALFTATKSGTFHGLPDWLSFLSVDDPGAGQSPEIATWVKIVCALIMASGTAAGGWKIIKTLGHRMVSLQPIHGFAAETSSSLVIWFASHYGIPVSTTHNITAAILGVGAAKNPHSVRWRVVEQILWAWIFTLPCAALVSYCLMSVAMPPR